MPATVPASPVTRADLEPEISGRAKGLGAAAGTFRWLSGSLVLNCLRLRLVVTLGFGEGAVDVKCECITDREDARRGGEEEVKIEK